MNEKRTIERLDHLTLMELIDIACGDLSLLGGDEALASHLVMEYKKVSDPRNFKRSLSDCAEITMRKGKMLYFSLLGILLEMGCEKEVREMVRDYRSKLYTASLVRLRRGIENLYESENTELMRIEIRMEKEGGGTLKQSPEKIRGTFFSEVATVIKVLKVSVDVKTINALVYANLRNQADEQIQETLRQLSRIKNR